MARPQLAASHAATPLLSATTALMRYARHLRASAPRVPITRDLLLQLDELVSDLRDGERVSAWYRLWDDVVRGMIPEATSPRTPACGRPLLLFMGYLGAALQEFGPQSIPPGVAIALMTEFGGGLSLLNYTQEDERVWIETTPAGVVQLGGAARLPLPVMPSGDDPAGVFAAFFQAL